MKDPLGLLEDTQDPLGLLGGQSTSGDNITHTPSDETLASKYTSGKFEVPRLGIGEASELSGLAIGSKLGLAAGGPAGAVLGGALGYGISKQGEKIYEQFTGKREPQGIGESFSEAAGDIHTGAKMEMTGQGVGKILGTATDKLLNSQLSAKLKEIIETGISKGTRPGVEGKQSSPQVTKFYERATEAVKTIIRNKNNLQLTDDAGNMVSKLPENLREFSHAVDQTKRVIFQEYDAMQQAAGLTGTRVQLGGIARELESISTNNVIRDNAPGAAKYAESKMKVFMERGSYSAQEAQDAIQIYNKNLDAFYKNPTYENASKASIDAMVANRMRKELDSQIESAVGKGYQELKNTYGALSTIEKDINRRAIVDARKNSKGLLDFSDIFSGSEVISGIVTLNPGRVTMGITAKAIGSLYSHMNNPNVIVKNMFKNSEKIMLGKTGGLKYESLRLGEKASPLIGYKAYGGEQALYPEEEQP